MQAPKKKTSPSRRGMRRSHDSLVPKKISECPNCKAAVQSYSVCLECGYYRGKLLVPVTASASAMPTA